MMLPGYCRACRRFRTVRCVGEDLVVASRTGIAFGLCGECRDRERAERELRKRARRV